MENIDPAERMNRIRNPPPTQQQSIKTGTATHWKLSDDDEDRRARGPSRQPVLGRGISPPSRPGSPSGEPSTSPDLNQQTESSKAKQTNNGSQSGGSRGPSSQPQSGGDIGVTRSTLLPSVTAGEGEPPTSSDLNHSQAESSKAKQTNNGSQIGSSRGPPSQPQSGGDIQPSSEGRNNNNDSESRHSPETTSHAQPDGKVIPASSAGAHDPQVESSKGKQKEARDFVLPAQNPYDPASEDIPMGEYDPASEDIPMGNTPQQEAEYQRPHKMHRIAYEESEVTERLRRWYLTRTDEEADYYYNQISKINQRLEILNTQSSFPRRRGLIPIDFYNKKRSEFLECIGNKNDLVVRQEWQKVRDDISRYNRAQEYSSDWNFPTDYLEKRFNIVEIPFMEEETPPTTQSSRGTQERTTESVGDGGNGDRSNVELEIDDSPEGLRRALEDHYPGMLLSGIVEGYRKIGSGYQCLVRYGTEDAPTFRLVPGASSGDWSLDDTRNIVTEQRGNIKENGKWRWTEAYVRRYAHVAWKPYEEDQDDALDSLHPRQLGKLGNAPPTYVFVFWSDGVKTWETRTTLRRLIGRDQQKADWAIYHRAKVQENRYLEQKQAEPQRRSSPANNSSETMGRNSTQPESRRAGSVRLDTTRNANVEPQYHREDNTTETIEHTPRIVKSVPRQVSTRLSTPPNASVDPRSGSMALYEYDDRDRFESTPRSNRFRAGSRGLSTPWEQSYNPKPRGYRTQSELRYDPKASDRRYYVLGEDSEDSEQTEEALTNKLYKSFLQRLNNDIVNGRSGRSGRSVSFVGVD